VIKCYQLSDTADNTQLIAIGLIMMASSWQRSADSHTRKEVSMNALQASLIVSGLFVLRLAIPLALTLIFGLLMNSLMPKNNVD
jgi:hypothetical protein